MPLNNLLKRIIPPPIRRERIRVHDPPKRIPPQIRTMRVQLASKIARSDVHLRAVEEPDDLDVVRGANVLQTRECVLGDETRASSGLCAPGDFFVLGVADCGVGVWRGPDTEV